MNSGFVNIPYIHVYPNLNYYFDFKGKRYKEKQSRHKLNNHSLVLERGKIWAMTIYYDYYFKLGVLPEIIIIKEEYDGKFGYQFKLNGSYEFTSGYSDLDDCYVDAYKHMFELLNIKGIR